MSFLTLGHGVFVVVENLQLCPDRATGPHVSKGLSCTPCVYCSPHTWTSIVQGTITCDQHTQTKKYFSWKYTIKKTQTNQMHSSDPVCEASLQLVGDSNRKETSCEWEGPAINTGGCQLPKKLLFVNWESKFSFKLLSLKQSKIHYIWL